MAIATASASAFSRLPHLGTSTHNFRGPGHTVIRIGRNAHWPSNGLSKVWDNRGGYHPLEEKQLTSPEIARTAVEANATAFLVFPPLVHCEPHHHLSWAHFQYVVDDFGDLYFQISDHANILQDPEATSPVNAFIGMDMPIYEIKTLLARYTVSDTANSEEIPFDDDYFEVVESDDSEVPVDWGMPHTSNFIHPIYFAKCLTKVVNMEYDRKMDHPSNGVSILGCLRPAFEDEELYVRRLFHCEDGDGYHSEWTDGEILSSDSKSDGSNNGSTLYRLEILGIELFSVYGVQSRISVQDFQDAEPDFLMHSTSVIVERFSEKGIRCDLALKALCKKKGLLVEEANLIGIDSLGVDVRVSFGLEVQTHRFPFKVRATSEVAAEKQIQQLLFPRSRRKKLRNQAQSDLRDPASL